MKALQNVCATPPHPTAEGICFDEIGPAFEGAESLDFVTHECVVTFAGLTEAGAQQVKQCMLDTAPGVMRGTVDITSRTQALGDCVLQLKSTN